jgi:hypothetical protein
MSLILNGTDGLSDVDGTAATPAIRGTDTNTGIFFPAADTIAFSEGGVESMRIDGSGNLGVGTTNPRLKLNVEGAYGNPVSSGSTPTGIARFSQTTNNVTLDVGVTTGNQVWMQGADKGDLSFKYDIVMNPIGGNLLVGTTSVAENSGVGLKIVSSSTNPSYRVVMNTATGGDAGFIMFNTNATNNGYRFFVKSDGGISNFSGNNTNLSDERTKENIELSSGYLEKICSIPVKLFNYKDEAKGSQKTLGVIAQDVEAVAPELVDKNSWIGESSEGEEPLKSVYTTDMMFAMMKAIQELKATVDAQAARIAALENPPAEI